MAFFRFVFSAFCAVVLVISPFSPADSDTVDVYLPGETYSATDVDGSTVSITIYTYNQTVVQFEGDAWAHYSIANVDIDAKTDVEVLMRWLTDLDDGSVRSTEILAKQGMAVDVLGTSETVTLQTFNAAPPSPSEDGSYVTLTFIGSSAAGSATYGALVDRSGSTPVSAAFGGDPVNDFTVKEALILQRAAGPYASYVVVPAALVGSGELDGILGAQLPSGGGAFGGPDPLIPEDFKLLWEPGVEVEDIPTSEFNVVGRPLSLQISDLGLGGDEQIVAEFAVGATTCPAPGTWNPDDTITFVTYCSAQFANPELRDPSCTDSASCPTEATGDLYDFVVDRTACRWTETYYYFDPVFFAELSSVGVAECDGASATFWPTVLVTGEYIRRDPAAGGVTSGLGGGILLAQGEPLPPTSPATGILRGDPTSPDVDGRIVVDFLNTSLTNRAGEAVTCGQGWENFVAPDGAASVSICDNITENGTTTPGRGIIFQGAKPLVADFTFAEVTTPPLTIEFTNTSTPASDCAESIVFGWDFGDGEGSSASSPAHTYGAPGDYNVTLSASHCGQSDDDTQTVTVTEDANEPPVADFDVVAISGTQVSFADRSKDDKGVVTWGWVFGDGGASAVQNPVHTYPRLGIYPVTLIVEDLEGETSSKEDNVVVKGFCDLDFQDRDGNDIDSVSFSAPVSAYERYEVYLVNRSAEPCLVQTTDLTETSASYLRGVDLPTAPFTLPPATRTHLADLTYEPENATVAEETLLVCCDGDATSLAYASLPIFVATGEVDIRRVRAPKFLRLGLDANADITGFKEILVQVRNESSQGRAKSQVTVTLISHGTPDIECVWRLDGDGYVRLEPGELKEFRFDLPEAWNADECRRSLQDWYALAADRRDYRDGLVIVELYDDGERGEEGPEEDRVVRDIRLVPLK